MRHTSNLHWEFTFRARRSPDLTLAARLDADGEMLIDYYVLPANLRPPGYLRLAERTAAG